MQAIQPWQNRKIHVIARSLDINDDELHMLVAGLTGLESIRALDSRQAGTVVAELETRQRAAGIVPPQPKPKNKPAPTSRPGMVTVPQQKKIWALIGELEKLDDAAGRPRPDRNKRLCGIIKKATETKRKKKDGMDSPPDDPFKWVRMDVGITVIDFLVRLVDSEKKKADKGGCVASG